MQNHRQAMVERLGLLERLIETVVRDGESPTRVASSERPKEEVDLKNGERGQTTLFRRRQGSEEDFTTNRIIFKKIFGSFYIRKKENY